MDVTTNRPHRGRGYPARPSLGGAEQLGSRGYGFARYLEKIEDGMGDDRRIGFDRTQRRGFARAPRGVRVCRQY